MQRVLSACAHARGRAVEASLEDVLYQLLRTVHPRELVAALVDACYQHVATLEERSPTEEWDKAIWGWRKLACALTRVEQHATETPCEKRTN